MDRFATRRAQFAGVLGDGIAVIAAGTETVRNDDVHHEFRQDSAFFFLTGFHEPDAVAILDPSHASEPYVLFVRPRDREMETWNGYRAGVEGAQERFAANAAFPIGELATELRKRLVGRQVLHYRRGGSADPAVDAALDAMRGLADRYGRTTPTAVVDPTPILDEMRLRKLDDEVESLRRACDISVEGHLEAMRFAAPGQYEYQVQSAMEFVFRQHGSMRNGYPSIVASGSNACVLHYVENDRRMEDGDLLLIDAAAEHGHFSSDITRTFPLNGAFTGPQRAVYEVVLTALEAGIEASVPGGSMAATHDLCCRILTEGLVDLGLLPTGVEDSLSMHHYKEFFMHGTGHWLGMDVHDAGMYRIDGRPLPLEAGMAFTVEPGLYIRPDRTTVEFELFEYDPVEQLERRLLLGPAKAKELEAEEKGEVETISWEIPEEFLGIGVRIEDDILVTEDGNENLTRGVPVEMDEIEAICSEAPRYTSAI
jgi:Xaa-Pro aminopeptidase